MLSSSIEWSTLATVAVQSEDASKLFLSSQVDEEWVEEADADAEALLEKLNTVTEFFDQKNESYLKLQEGYEKSKKVSFPDQWTRSTITILLHKCAHTADTDTHTQI